MPEDFQVSAASSSVLVMIPDGDADRAIMAIDAVERRLEYEKDNQSLFLAFRAALTAGELRPVVVPGDWGHNQEGIALIAATRVLAAVRDGEVGIEKTAWGHRSLDRWLGQEQEVPGKHPGESFWVKIHQRNKFPLPYGWDPPEPRPQFPVPLEEDLSTSEDWRQWADRQYDRARDLEEVLRGYKKAIELDPTNVDTLLGKGRVLEELGRMEEEANAYRDVLKLNPLHLRALENLGLVLAEQEEFLDALHVFVACCALDPCRRNFVRRINEIAGKLVKPDQAEQAVLTVRDFLDQDAALQRFIREDPARFEGLGWLVQSVTKNNEQMREVVSRQPALRLLLDKSEDGRGE